LLYTGRDVMGDEALRIGLADRVADPDGLRSSARQFADEIAASAPLSLLAIRETMRRDLAEQVRRAAARENAEQQHLRTTHDFQEGVAAIAERRPPVFRGE
jgi:enoyl-CoA hydratase/carnithine racemase